MTGEIKLHIPKRSELWYRQRLLGDKETMSYNKRHGSENGCIDFPESKWEDWYRQFVQGSPVGKFYAYMVRREDGVFVGEVNLHQSPDSDPYEDRYDMGIVTEAAYRGNGYGTGALELLMETAFEETGAASVHNSFEVYRKAALDLHLKAGFKIVGQDNHIIRLSITAKEYELLKKQKQTDNKNVRGCGT